MGWAIVHFTRENSVEAVPKTWFIESSNECFWPPKSYKNEQIFRLIQDQARPESDWKPHSAVILGFYDDFATAERKAKKATKSSDLSSSTDTAFTKSRKRKRKKNRKYQSDSSSRDSPSDFSDDDYNCYPLLDKKKTLESSASQTVRTQSMPSCSMSKGPVETVSMTKERPATPVAREELNLHGKNSQSREIRVAWNTPSRNIEESNLRPDISTSLSRHKNICPDDHDNRFTPPNNTEHFHNHLEISSTHRNVRPVNDNEFKRFVMDELTDLNFKANAIMESLKTLTAARQLESTTQLAVFENTAKTFYEKIPIKNPSELTAFEEWLMSDSNYGLVLSELTRFGGKSLGQNVRRIMYRLLTDEVALMYSWDGAKEKKTFKNLRLAKVIVDSMKFQYKTCKETEIIGAIKYWLVKAKERIKNREKGKNKQEVTGNESFNEEN